ncbi:MAG: helix-turn-helix domain-containing protein [Burkholderiaceae bacterium]|mgnify:CR=1 FL=1|nr:helix-turn-helix domain-containing protein [Burkholderiaceae bacterium]MCD6675287.1 helix-turn-helix domain-containing protein [Burkholderiaceae bacterium]
MLVHKLRLQRGWSQEQLASLSGLSVRTIQRIESGQSASAESLKALAAVFEVDFQSLQTLQTEADMPGKTSPVPQRSEPSMAAEEALALEQVRRIRGFYVHLMQYALVVAGLALVNYFFAPRFPWVLFVALGWGLGILLHGLRAFGLPILGPEWERRQVEKRLGRPL